MLYVYTSHRGRWRRASVQSCRDHSVGSRADGDRASRSCPAALAPAACVRPLLNTPGLWSFAEELWCPGTRPRQDDARPPGLRRSQALACRSRSRWKTRALSGGHPLRPSGTAPGAATSVVAFADGTVARVRMRRSEAAREGDGGSLSRTPVDHPSDPGRVVCESLQSL